MQIRRNNERMQFFSLLTHLHLIKTMSSLAELGGHNEWRSEVRKIVLSHPLCHQRHATEVLVDFYLYEIVLDKYEIYI